MPYESLFDNDWDDFWTRCGDASPQSLSRLAAVIDQPRGIPQHGGVGRLGGPPFDLGLATPSVGPEMGCAPRRGINLKNEFFDRRFHVRDGNLRDLADEFIAQAMIFFA